MQFVWKASFKCGTDQAGRRCIKRTMVQGRNGCLRPRDAICSAKIVERRQLYVRGIRCARSRCACAHVGDRGGKRRQPRALLLLTMRQPRSDRNWRGKGDGRRSQADTARGRGCREWFRNVSSVTKMVFIAMLIIDARMLSLLSRSTRTRARRSRTFASRIVVGRRLSR